MAEIKNYDILNNDIKKIKTLADKIPISEQIYKKIEESKKLFNTLLDDPSSNKYYIFTVLCLAALIFDFFISTKTLDWVHTFTHVPVVILALIFTIIDAGLAVLSSGLLAKDDIQKHNMKKTFRPILWSLGVVKMILFVVFTKIVAQGVFAQDWMMVGMQLLFTLLVYIILDKTGEGIWFGINKIKFFISEEIWNESPDSLMQKLKVAYDNLHNKIKRFEFNKDEVYEHFDLKNYQITERN